MLTIFTNMDMDLLVFNLIIILVFINGSVIRSESTTCGDNRNDSFRIWKGYITQWQENAGSFSKRPRLHTLKECVQDCCNRPHECDVVFFKQRQCFHIQCRSNESCRPQKVNSTSDLNNPFLVVVRPVRNRNTEDFDDTFTETNLSEDDSTNKFTRNFISPPASTVESASEPSEPTIINTAIVSKERYCQKDADCFQGELCRILKNQTTAICVQNSSYLSDLNLKFVPNANTSTGYLSITITGNKTIQLPTNETTITASTQPSGKNYSYQWTLLTHPTGDESGVMQGANMENLKLTKLRQGIYTFNVTVTGNDAIGSAVVNVSVLAPKRLNQRPTVVIQPAISVVQLPNKDTVLDGSASKDDDKIMTYKWEPVQVPIGYQTPADLELNKETLQLKNLLPGNYSFQLTVVDSDHASDSAAASITVLKEIDYTPTANAGNDIIINLPQNEVTLNGNQSTDDKKIVSWLWTRVADAADASNSRKAIDMDGTTTPYLHLSNLELGVYKFELCVTDSANQSSKAEVHVFVKPEIYTKPTANAGKSQSIELPLDKPVILDGSLSKDTSLDGIVKWLWEQKSGPKPAKILNETSSKTVVEGFIPGPYTFKLTVFNSKGANASDLVNVSATQVKNLPPIARSGGDQTVTLPANLVTLNGTNSSDDIDIQRYKWTRDPGSLAYGKIVDNSDSKPVLELTDLIPGRYQFRLTVFDGQGASSSDTMTLTVKPDPLLNSQVELLLNAYVLNFTYDMLINAVKRVELLLNDAKSENVQVTNAHCSMETRTQRVILLFSVETVTGKALPGPDVVGKLKKRLLVDSTIIIPQVLRIETTVCQNACSGHGSCDIHKKVCICEPFWTQDFVSMYFGWKESNCDWSILYVTIIAIILTVLLAGSFWSFICLTSHRSFCKLSYWRRKASRKTHARRVRSRRSHSATRHNQHKRYTLVPNNFHGDDGENGDNDDDTGFLPSKKVLSSSDELESALSSHYTALNNRLVFKRHFSSDIDSDSDVALFNLATKKSDTNRNNGITQKKRTANHHDQLNHNHVTSKTLTTQQADNTNTNPATINTSSVATSKPSVRFSSNNENNNDLKVNIIT